MLYQSYLPNRPRSTQLKEEDDVYDVVDQEDYEKLVESRRQMDDFVVDDGRGRGFGSILI